MNKYEFGSSFVAPTVQPFQFYTPNTELLAKTLLNQQQFYDASMQEFDRELNVNPGDVDYKNEILTQMSNTRDEVIDTYANGDIRAANRRLKDAARNIKRDFTIGKAAKLTANYKYAQEFAKEQKERMEKGELDRYAYQASTMPIKTFQTFDENGEFQSIQNALISRPKSINIDEFANEWIKNWEADTKLNFANPVYDPKTGHVGWYTDKHKFVRKDEVWDTMTQALTNATNQTGQMRDKFMVTHGPVGEQRRQEVRQQLAQSVQEAQDEIDQLNSLSGPELVKYLSQNYNTSPSTPEDAAITKAMLINGLTDARNSLSLKAKSPDGKLDEYLIETFARQDIRQLTEPYAQKAAFDQDESSWSWKVSPFLQDELARKRDLDNWMRDNPNPNLYSISKGISSDAIGGETIRDVQNFVKDMESNLNELEGNIASIYENAQIGSSAEAIKLMRTGDWGKLKEHAQVMGYTPKTFAELQEKYIKMQRQNAAVNARIDNANIESGLNAYQAKNKQYVGVYEEAAKAAGIPAAESIDWSQYATASDEFKLTLLGYSPLTASTQYGASEKGKQKEMYQKQVDAIDNIINQRGFNKNQLNNYYEKLSDYTNKRNDLIKNHEYVADMAFTTRLPGLSEQHSAEVYRQAQLFFKNPLNWQNATIQSGEGRGTTFGNYVKDSGWSLGSDSDKAVVVGSFPMFSQHTNSNGELLWKVEIDTPAGSKTVFVKDDDLSFDGLKNVKSSPRFDVNHMVEMAGVEMGNRGTFSPPDFSNYGVSLDYTNRRATVLGTPMTFDEGISTLSKIQELRNIYKMSDKDIAAEYQSIGMLNALSALN